MLNKIERCFMYDSVEQCMFFAANVTPLKLSFCTYGHDARLHPQAEHHPTSIK
jgi:hypothetical protein